MPTQPPRPPSDSRPKPAPAASQVRPVAGGTEPPARGGVPGTADDRAVKAVGRVGTQLGPFRLKAVAEADDKSVLYRAVDTTLDRPVVVRVLPAAHVERIGVDKFVGELREACRREAAGAQSILQIGRSGPDFFVAMQAADGVVPVGATRPSWMIPAIAAAVVAACVAAGVLLWPGGGSGTGDDAAEQARGGPQPPSDPDAGETSAKDATQAKTEDRRPASTDAPDAAAKAATKPEESFEALPPLKPRRPAGSPDSKTAPPTTKPDESAKAEPKAVEPNTKAEPPSPKVADPAAKPERTDAKPAEPVAKVDVKPAEPTAKTDKADPKATEKTDAKPTTPDPTPAVPKTKPALPSDFALREPVIGRPDLSARVNAAIEKARDNLFKLQQDTLLVVHGRDQTAVVVEWKDVQVEPAARRVRIKGRVFDNVSAVLPPGWFAETNNAVPGALAGRLEHLAGHSALVTAALLAAGVDPGKDARMRKAIESQAYMWLPRTFARNAPGADVIQGPSMTYSIGLRAVCLELALRKIHGPMRGDLVKALRRDGALLAGGHTREGGYGYHPTVGAAAGGGWDMSNCQYGVLGLWAASMVPEVELNANTWATFNRFYLQQQSKDGGWGYTGRGNSYAEMTAAGLASLYLVLDLAYTRGRGAAGPEVAPYDRDPMLRQTLAGLSHGLDRFGRSLEGPWHGYLRYGIERVGVASGHKYFGTMDWFRRGAEELITKQDADGGWVHKDAGRVLDGNPARETAWNLLFLVYGGAPVMINKLKYGAAEDWAWNNYPRDAANLARWNAQTFEEPANWQIVDLATGTDDDLLDAPILYISGHKAITFAEAQVERLRRYVERGGTIVAAVNGNATTGAAFVRSIEDLCKRLYSPDDYPQHRLQTARPDHPVFAMGAVIESPAAPKAAVSKIPMRHMHNGRRSFLFLITEDVQHAWHGRKTSARPEVFSLAANIKRYALDRGPLWAKGRSEIKFADPPAPAGKVRIGVVRFESDGQAAWADPAAAGKNAPQPVRNDWNGLPATWKSYAPWLRAAAGYEIEEVRGVDLAALDPAGFDVLHISGQYEFQLNPAQREGLRKYLAGGGTLLAEQVNGRDPLGKRPFFDSAKAILTEMFPAAPPKPLNAGAAVVGGRLADRQGFDCSQVTYSRTATLARDGNTACALTVVEIDGRPAAILSAYDLSTALCGQACFEREGLGADSARKLTANLLVLAARSAATGREKAP